MDEPETKTNYEELYYRVLEAERGLLRRVLGPEACEREKGSPLPALEQYIHTLQQKEVELQALQIEVRDLVGSLGGPCDD